MVGQPAEVEGGDGPARYVAGRGGGYGWLVQFGETGGAGAVADGLVEEV